MRRRSKPHTTGTKQADELSDHDVIVGHGMVDWVTVIDIGSSEHVLAHVHSNTPERGSYTLCLTPNQRLKYERY